MRFFTPLLLMALMGINAVHAEGTRQMAPNASIMIGAATTTDIAALHINNPSYNNFAAYNNPNPQNRLYIHIKDPQTECIYLGFNWGHNNITTMNPPRIQFEYRIKDPNGNIVFGPVTVDPANPNINNWSEAFNGPMQIYGAAGYNATHVTGADLQSQGWSGKGDYYIEFNDIENNDFLIDFWDISVANCSGPAPVEMLGRIWSFNWAIFAINDFGFPLRPFNGAFFVCAPDPDNIHASFVTKIDFNGSGFRPAAFNIAFNSFGIMNTGNIMEDRKSIENTNATQAEYAIFLNDPVDICETAEVGEITILGISRCAEGEYCIKFTTSKAGQIDLLLDFDGGDNVYTPGTADVMLVFTVTPDQVGIPTCIPWDGKDGLGNPMPEDVATQIPVTLFYAQGIYHFPIYDAEYMTDGFQIAAVRPAAPVTLLFYDDSNISVPSGSGEPSVQLAGCMTPCHRWTNYTMPNTPGFGNLHTINSWWFSQLIVRQDVFFLPAYFTCDIEGQDRFCAGGSAQLTFKGQLLPAPTPGYDIISNVWTGPGIVGPDNQQTCTIDQPGIYTITVGWMNNLGDTCYTTCSHEVAMDPPLTSHIDTLIVEGESVTINGEVYTEGGLYEQILTTSEGCDSILTIRVVVLNTVIYYDLNACESFMSNNTHMDYSEFVPVYPQPLSCASIIADTLYRNNPAMNKHSCTPGVNDSPGMCVGALNSCTYQAGHDASVIIEFNVEPGADTAVYFTGLSFFEKAPLTYDWISGSSGPNNYPTLFGLRILANGVEIFRDEAIPTAFNWNERVFDFYGNVDFLVKDPTVFRVELLPYCPVGNGATESVWDLDDIRLVASCASPEGLNKNIGGFVTAVNGQPLPDVAVLLSADESLLQYSLRTTDEAGAYQFASLPPETAYFLQAHDTRDVSNGVNTLDLLYIQKHLLGIKPFTSPYEMIAADVNRTNSISALDLVEIRKLILGIYDAFPKNTSWRFGRADQTLEVGTAWQFDPTHRIEYLEDHIDQLNFIGVKIGDVNGDVVVQAGAQALRTRQDPSVDLMPDASPAVQGEVVRVDIRNAADLEIAGLQLLLETAGTLLEIQAGVLDVNEAHYHVGLDGKIRLSWTTDQLRSLKAGDILFSLVILSETDDTRSLVRLTNGSLRNEIYLGEELSTHSIRFTDPKKEQDEKVNRLYPVTPNPFTNTTMVRFDHAEPGQVTLQVYTLSGTMIHSRTGQFSGGEHTLEITADELGHPEGMLILKVQAGAWYEVQKMIIVR